MGSIKRKPTPIQPIHVIPVEQCKGPDHPERVEARRANLERMKAEARASSQQAIEQEQNQ